MGLKFAYIGLKKLFRVKKIMANRERCKALLGLVLFYLFTVVLMFGFSSSV